MRIRLIIVGGRKAAMILLRALLIAVAMTGTAQAAQEGDVWFWFAACGGPTLNLEVRFDQKAIFKSWFPLCRAARSSFYSEGQRRRLHFDFKPRRSIVWEGYREEHNTTTPNQSIEGDIWLAGADPDALLLGITLMTRDSIYMNTIHIAHPSLRDQPEIAPGLVVITTPAATSEDRSK
jgi:hypothetical protein